MSSNKQRKLEVKAQKRKQKAKRIRDGDKELFISRRQKSSSMVPHRNSEGLQTAHGKILFQKDDGEHYSMVATDEGVLIRDRDKAGFIPDSGVKVFFERMIKDMPCRKNSKDYLKLLEEGKLDLDMMKFLIVALAEHIEIT